MTPRERQLRCERVPARIAMLGTPSHRSCSLRSVVLVQTERQVFEASGDWFVAPDEAAHREHANGRPREAEGGNRCWLERELRRSGSERIGAPWFGG